ncbi:MULTISPECIES: Flp1 family type IVb pilin [unclassified Virgibacillus]|uniref:Flp1 family type IVb pilin n=1 Tax=unclassified Virgibacillus TaxID=2620237 RepID=UPI0024DEA28A|nr:Flp1 family type IVb pilin [Virgibacillus sp. LDC-1]
MEKLKGFFTDFWKDEEGLQTLEIMLIIAVIVFIALMFREKIIAWVNALFKFGDENIENFSG